MEYKKIISNKLLIAVDINDIIEVKELLKSGADVNISRTMDKVATLQYGQLESYTPLILAAKKGYSEILHELLRSPDIDVNKMESSMAALHVACEEGQVQVVKLLLAFDGIDVNVTKSDYGFSRVIKVYDRDPAEEDKASLHTPEMKINKTHGWTPLHIAVEKNQVEIIAALLSHPNIDLNIQDILHGYTPLHMAANGGYPSVLKLLLANPKIDMNVKDKCGRTALELAMQNEHELSVQVLQNA